MNDYLEQYRELAIAIVRRASQDYLSCYYAKRRLDRPSYVTKWLNAHENSEEEFREYVEYILTETKRIERFFRVDMQLMFDIDSEEHIKRLRKMSETRRLLPDVRLRRQKDEI